MCPWEHVVENIDGFRVCDMVCLSCGDMDFCWEHEHGEEECDCEGTDD